MTSPESSTPEPDRDEALEQEEAGLEQEQGNEEKAPEGSNPTIIAVCIGVIIFLLAIGLVQNIGGDDAPKEDLPKRERLKKIVSKPLDTEEVKRLAARAKLPKAFWLGDSVRGLEPRADLSTGRKELMIAYLDRADRYRVLVKNQPSFRILVATQERPRGASLRMLTRLASKTIKRPGLTVYLPPKRALEQQKMFAVSDDGRWVGVIITVERPTLKDMERLAQKVSLVSVDPS